MINKEQDKSIWAKIGSIAINAVLVLFILIGILIAISILPVKNNYRILAVMGGSMEPTIPLGALIVVKPVSDYRVGDIITFKSGLRKNDYTTHRIKAVEEGENQKAYITKGDANEDPETEKITQDKIFGKEFFSIALLGYVLGYIKTLPGLLIIIIIPAVIIIYEEINKIKKEAQRIIKEKKKLKKAQNEENLKKS